MKIRSLAAPTSIGFALMLALGGGAQALIKFLTAPAAAPVIRAKGMEPG